MKHFALAALLTPIALLASDAKPHAGSAPPAEQASFTLPAWAVALPSDDVSDAERDAIQHEARAFARSAPPQATRELLAHLTRSSARCGRAHSAALAGAFSADIDPTEITVAVESSSVACTEVVIETAGFVPNPDRNLAAALLERTRFQANDDVRRVAWLAYGSIAETARERGDGGLAGSIDAILASRLASASGEERVLMVRAAGNAGCVACAPVLAEDATSHDDVLRRTAIAAHRFLGTKDSVDRMCGALEADSDGTARDLAAWALEWRSNDGADRAQCLERAATRDRSKAVRLQAVRALGILADDAPEAHDALARLADRRGDVGALALQTLDVRRGSEIVADDWMVVR